MRAGKTIAIAQSVAACCILLGSPANGQDASTRSGKIERDITFSDYAINSSNAELARRFFSPLTVMRLNSRLSRNGEKLAPQPIDLSQERFALYVPTTTPPEGYGLLVFVPPWSEDELPPGWASVLDQFGVIFVSAARSGNDQSVLGRRAPLALLAAANVMKQFKINPERIYVGGFSGGSHVALRLALAYPDLFRGALLNAGTDRITESYLPLPARDLFLQFQSRSRLVYVTGEYDRTRLSEDSSSISSMREWCAAGVSSQSNLGVGHEVLNASVFGRAMRQLLEPVAPDASELADCRSRHERDLGEHVHEAESLVASGKTEDAKSVLKEIDARFGGLQPLEVLDLDAKLGLDMAE